MTGCGQFADSLRTEESAAEQSGLLADMSTYEKEIARIEALVEDVRAICDRSCEPKNQSNPRYHALSMAVSGLKKAAD
jgi:hypothetical protein